MSKSNLNECTNMGLRTFIIKRAIYSFILILFVLSLNFIIFQLMPGNPVEIFTGGLRIKNPEMINVILARFGLDRPPHERYVIYIYNMLTGQFGVSFFSGDYVIKEVGERLANTLILLGTTEILAIAFGVLLGVIAAHRRGGVFDSGSVLVSLTTYSLPSFWMGMILLLIFYYHLGWFPGGHTYPLDWAQIYQSTGGLPPRIILGEVFGTQIAIPQEHLCLKPSQKTTL